MFDSCKDASINVTSTVLAAAAPPSNLLHLLLINQPTPVWETSAYNIGMRAAHASSQFLVLVQDDMQMLWQGWNTLLALPMRLYPDNVFLGGYRGCVGGERALCPPPVLPGIPGLELIRQVWSRRRPATDRKSQHPVYYTCEKFSHQGHCQQGTTAVQCHKDC